jgi:hypothetical protein
VTPDEFNALFDEFHGSVFRLEALPVYDVGGADAERLAAFLEGRALPERSVRTSAWLARIAVSTVVGKKRWSRTRVVDDPLTDYERYEIEAYRESQAAGEQIQIVRRAQVGDVGPDFWLFDGDTPHARAVRMNYDEAGQWHGADLITERGKLAEFDERRRAVEAVAVPLNEYVVGVRD